MTPHTERPTDAEMVYLLDANVVINAGRDYYPPDRVPEFWDWLLEMGESRLARIPQEIYDEIVFPPSPRKTEDPVAVAAHRRGSDTPQCHP